MSGTEENPNASSQSPRYTVAMVDDDQFLLDMYALKFKEAGHIVQAYLKPREFLEALRNGLSPDAMVMDLVMPEIDGLSLLKSVQEEGFAPKAAKVVLSNQGQDTDIEAALALGVDGYIVKASTIPSEVLAQVESIISEKQKKQRK